MKILVIDTAASCGGALTILQQKVKTAEKDKKNQYLFLTSVAIKTHSKNIKNIAIEKPSWINRIYFDVVGYKKYIREFQPNIVYSLQNTIPNAKNAKKWLYVHQPLPFQKIKSFSFFRREERELAIRQKILGLLIKKSCKKADKIIVQTEWMKKAVCLKCNIASNKVVIEKPSIYIPQKILALDNNYNNVFFYPTSNILYKNNTLLVDASKILEQNNITNYRIELTLTGNNTKNIKYIGKIPRNEVLKRFKKTILVFPSYIESYGLPLAEARKCNCFIIASDTPFSHEILKGYKRVIYFNAFDANDLAHKMSSIINSKKTS